MSIFSPLGPATLVGVSLTIVAPTVSACSPSTPEEDAVQSSAQSSVRDTGRSASQIGNCRIIPLSEVNPDALGEFYELFPETKTVPDDVLLEELTREIEDAKTMGITPEEYFRNAIEAVRVNDGTMRRAAEEATGDAPAQSH